MRATPNLGQGVCCSTLGTTWIQSCCPQVWTRISSLGSRGHDEDNIRSAQVSLTILLLCSSGFNEEEINCMEKKSKEKGRHETREGWGKVTENRLRGLSTAWIWSKEKVRRLEGEGYCNHWATRAEKAQGCLHKYRQAQSDWSRPWGGDIGYRNCLWTPPSLPLESWIEVFTFPFLPFRSSLLLW